MRGKTIHDSRIGKILMRWLARIVFRFTGWKPAGKTINPDARQYFMDEPNTSSSPRSGLVPMENDRDGLYDEDKYDDLNNDGIISMKRRRSPYGNYNSDPKDPRRMVRCAPGEKGECEMLGLEGIDNDGDGLVNEDGVGGYDPNRDYGFNWEPGYVQQGAGKYPFSFPENQAVRDFGFKHRNITGSQSFHNSGGMVLRGPAIQGGGAARITTLATNAVMMKIAKMLMTRWV